MIKTLLFDIYQTLIDVDIEQNNLSKSWKVFDNYVVECYRNYKIKTPFEKLVNIQDYKFYKDKDIKKHHRDFKESIKEVFNNNYRIYVADKQLDKLIWEFRTKSRDYYNLYPLVKKTLNCLASEYTLATASISHESYTLRELKELGIKKYFTNFIFSSNTGYKKPEKEFFKIALKKTRSKPSNTIMIGDDLYKDIWGAQQLGLWTIFVKNPITYKSNPNITPTETVSIDHFNHIVKAVKHIKKFSFSKNILGEQPE